MSYSKYKAVPTLIDGIRFPSKKQARDYQELKLQQLAGNIGYLRLEVPFEIKVKGIKICRYIADFVYSSGGNEIIADSKGVITPVFRLKWKLMKACYPQYEYRIL